MNLATYHYFYPNWKSFKLPSTCSQQIIDWIDWIEKNNSYARAKLKGLLTPKGFVIIGRESSLNEKTKASLLRRNKAFNGLIEILTYDDLLNKAECILKILKKDIK